MPVKSCQLKDPLVVSPKRPRVFFFHYNKPASQTEKRPQISIHYCDTCYIVDNLVCECGTYGHVNKRQPYFVMKGKAARLEIKDGTAIIR
jgi:hypothetical protein